MKLISKLILYLLLGSLKPGALREIAEIKICIAYIKAIKIIQSLMAEAITLAVCIFFIATGVILLHFGLIVYGPWTEHTKFIIILCLGGIYLLLFSIILFYKTSQKNWMKLLEGYDLIKKIL